MTADPGREEPLDDGLDDAWAQIVAGYDRQVDDAERVVQRPPTADVGETQDAGDGVDVGDAHDTGTVRSRPVPWDDEGHYVPPPPPPLPRPAGAVGAAWIGLICGPMVLLVATALGWQLPALATSACVLGFVGGVVFLILQMDDGDRDGRDGWDDGAQV